MASSMKLSIRSDGAAALTLPATMDLPAAAHLRDAVSAAKGKDLVLDASGVERLGANCAQVLRALALAWRADGAALILERPSPTFLDDLALLGLSPDGVASEQRL
jgi:chemotaxis protein CheX